MSGLAVVRSIGTARSLRSVEELEDFEQELVDQYCLAMLGAGLSDAHVAEDRRILFELIEFLGVRVWATTPEDADRWLHWLRRHRRQARSTVQGKAWALAQFFEFLLVRYQADIHALTGCVVVQPVDEFNRPAKADYGSPRIPPSTEEVDALFNAWRDSLPESRKYLTAARDYLAAGPDCASTRASDSTSATGDPISASTASCMSASARAATDGGPSPVWYRASTPSTSSSTGGSLTCATSSPTAATIPTRRCCPANDATATPARWRASVRRRCGAD